MGMMVSVHLVSVEVIYNQEKDNGIRYSKQQVWLYVHKILVKMKKQNGYIYYK